MIIDLGVTQNRRDVNRLVSHMEVAAKSICDLQQTFTRAQRDEGGGRFENGSAYLKLFCTRLQQEWRSIQRLMHTYYRWLQVRDSLSRSEGRSASGYENFLSYLRNTMLNDSREISQQCEKTAIDFSMEALEVEKGVADLIQQDGLFALQTTSDALCQIHSVLDMVQMAMSNTLSTPPQSSILPQSISYTSSRPSHLRKSRKGLNEIFKSIGAMAKPCNTVIGEIPNELDPGSFVPLMSVGELKQQLDSLCMSAYQSFRLIEPWRTAHSDLGPITSIIARVQSQGAKYHIALNSSIKSSDAGFSISIECERLCQSLISGMSADDIKETISELRSMAKLAHDEAQETSRLFRSVRQGLDEASRAFPKAADELREVGVPLQSVVFLTLTDELPVDQTTPFGPLQSSLLLNDQKMKPQNDDEAQCQLITASVLVTQLANHVDVFVNWWLKLDSNLNHVEKKANRLDPRRVVKLNVTRIAAEWKNIREVYFGYKAMVSKLQDYFLAHGCSAPMPPNQLNAHTAAAPPSPTIGSGDFDSPQEPLRFEFSLKAAVIALTSQIELVTNTLGQLKNLQRSLSQGRTSGDVGAHTFRDQNMIADFVNATASQLQTDWSQLLPFLHTCCRFGLELLVLKNVVTEPDFYSGSELHNGEMEDSEGPILEMHSCSVELFEQAEELATQCRRVGREVARRVAEVKGGLNASVGGDASSASSDIASLATQSLATVTSALAQIHTILYTLHQIWKFTSIVCQKSIQSHTLRAEEEVVSLANTWKENQEVLVRALGLVQKAREELQLLKEVEHDGGHEICDDDWEMDFVGQEPSPQDEASGQNQRTPQESTAPSSTFLPLSIPLTIPMPTMNLDVVPLRGVMTNTLSIGALVGEMAAQGLLMDTWVGMVMGGVSAFGWAFGKGGRQTVEGTEPLVARDGNDGDAEDPHGPEERV